MLVLKTSSDYYYIMSGDIMGHQGKLSPTEDPSSTHKYGGNCAKISKSSKRWARHTTHKPMDKQREPTRA